MPSDKLCLAEVIQSKDYVSMGLRYNEFQGGLSAMTIWGKLCVLALHRM